MSDYPALNQFVKLSSHTKARIWDCSTAGAWTFAPQAPTRPKDAKSSDYAQKLERYEKMRRDYETMPDIIQMCPWYLDYIMKKEFTHGIENFTPKGKMASILKFLHVSKAAKPVVPWSPIDLWSFGDATLAHEVSLEGDLLWAASRSNTLTRRDLSLCIHADVVQRMTLAG